MARIQGRDFHSPADPLSDRATGLWFHRPGNRRKRYQRYDEAAPFDGTVHWYKEDGGPWRAFRTDQVVPVKTRKKGAR